MKSNDVSPLKKALKVNLDPKLYGTFAEIGAGQDVVRHFFQAGRASQTIAKSMSAYDMVFSDAIYGKTGRYVSKERLLKMLEHEYSLLEERLKTSRGSSTCFFAFANTVATQQSQGWMGLRFQSEELGPTNDVILHVRLLDRSRLAQQEALGILGVNLIEACFYSLKSTSQFLDALTDHLRQKRIEIDMISFTGESVKHFDNRLLSLELVRRGLTDAILFDGDGHMLQPSDAFFKKPILVQRGTFRPITKTNLDILNRGVAQIKKDWPLEKEPQVLFEMTMHNLSSTGEVDIKDYLQRVDSLSSLGHPVLISNFFLFYGLKTYIRRHTDQPIGIVIGASHLEKLFDQKYYTELEGGMLEGFSRLFDQLTRLYVYPFKSAEICQTSETLFLKPPLDSLYKFLKQSDGIVDLADCDDVDTSIHSHDVHEMLKNNDPKWENLVPKEVLKKIKSDFLFGFRS